ncbi:unnamed protein product, partial [Rotaria magnacalcarata]
FSRGKEQDVESREVETDETGREEEANDNANNVAQAVGHNMYILTYQAID